MNRSGKRTELLNTTERKKVFEVLKFVGLCVVPMVKMYGRINEVLQKFQDPLGTIKLKKKGTQELTLENNLTLDEFVRVCQECSRLDCSDDPVFKILCEGQIPDVAFFCKKLTLQKVSRRPKHPGSRGHSHGSGSSTATTTVCKDCAVAVNGVCVPAEPPKKIPANVFAEWKHMTEEMLEGYNKLVSRQKDLEGIVRQVDPKNSTSLRAMMRNKELDKSHEIISKLMKELKGPIDLDELFVCICCNPPQTTGGRELNQLHNGVKKNVNCLEGGVIVAPPKGELKPVEVKKSDESTEAPKADESKESTKSEVVTSEPEKAVSSPCKCLNKELYLKLKNGPKPGQVVAEISSCGSKGSDVIVKEMLKCCDKHCFCEEKTVMDLLHSDGMTVEFGCFEITNDEVVLVNQERNYDMSPEMYQTICSLMAEYKRCKEESLIALNSRIMDRSAKIMHGTVHGNEETISMKAKVTVTITKKEPRKVSQNKRKSNKHVQLRKAVVQPLVDSSSIEDINWESEEEGVIPSKKDCSNDNKDWVEVEDKACQTSDYSGDESDSNDYWMFNFPKNAQEIKILTQSHTFKRTTRVRAITKKVYRKSVDPTHQ